MRRPTAEGGAPAAAARRTHRSKTVRAKLDASVGYQFLIAVLAATNIVPEANESNNVVVSPAIARGTSNDRD